MTTISSPAFSAAYDGDGLRARKTAGGVTTYYVYDGNSPVAEESYNSANATATFLNLNGTTADGWRTRYDSAAGQSDNFAYDPQGSRVETHTATSYSTGAPAFELSFYEGYGALRQNVQVGSGATATPRDPAGFGGQFGYYTDVETGLLCLTHRYYDPGTGKFLNRDPIGYQGGANLYGFADGNPVNESDPDGTQGSSGSPDPNNPNGPNLLMPSLGESPPADPIYSGGGTADQQEHLSTAAVLPGRVSSPIAARTIVKTLRTTKVPPPTPLVGAGRWMGEEEFDKMLNTGWTDAAYPYSGQSKW